MSTIPTPPPTTLSEESDTEVTAESLSPIHCPDMGPPPPRPIYLIVATSLPSLGIGLKGTLPWPSLKKDMAFFRRVTSASAAAASTTRAAVPGRRNAVVMGRRTWESIPAKFRPLKGRVNVVLTRRAGALAEADGQEVFATESLQGALGLLERDVAAVGRVFVIGGRQIYDQAVGLEGSVAGFAGLRILQTQVRRRDGAEIECDTLFPLKLGEGDTETEGWRRASREEVEEWVDGETVPGGDGDWEEDGDMEIRVVGWERRTGES